MTAPLRTLAKSPSRGVRITAFAATGLAFAMVGVAFASVPLYDLFCKVTGFGGTPLRSDQASAEILDRVMTIRFDANVAPGLGWRFAPEVPSVDIKVGETKTLFYRVTNPSTTPVTGIAAYNVEPGMAAAYFIKMQCFCFTEQTLAAGETMDFPVVFYIDPAIAKDRNLDGTGDLTLSYTYFPSKGGAPVAATSAAVTGTLR